MQYDKTTNKGLRRLIYATKFSKQGFVSTFKSEQAFRLEVYVSIIAIPLSFFIATSLIEWILLVASLLLLMTIEIINSAIEAVVDRFGGEIHPLSGKAKDAASAAVGLAIVITLIIWLPMIYNRII